MSFPFYNAIKSTTAGTPGASSFVPNGAATGFRGWSAVPPGWIGLVRYEDGPSWELSYGHWNGTAVTRPAGGFFASSSGSQLSLTSSATAALIVDALDTAWQLGAGHQGVYTALTNSNAINAIGLGISATTGTAAATTPSSTNFLTTQLRVQYTSATTANALAGVRGSGTPEAWYTTTAGSGGGMVRCQFGISQLPTGPRFLVGACQANTDLGTNEPSTGAFYRVGFAKDSTDTNLQFLSYSGSAATKTDTGLMLTANAWYDVRVWWDPGGGRFHGLLFRRDNGDIFYASHTATLPATNSGLIAICQGGLSATTGTAIIVHVGTLGIRAA